MSKSACSGAGCGAAIYGLGFIGALVYFLQQASSFTEGLLGIIKSLFWPAFMVYVLFGFLYQ